MTSTVNIWVQILVTLAQVLNAINVASLPKNWQAAFTGLFTIVQAVLGVIAHYYTPSGVSITAGSTITTKEGGSQAATSS
jgi:hypothetical protein